MTCRGFKYEEDETYEMPEEDVECCKAGFHACEYPLDVFAHYAPAASIYREVAASGKIDKNDDGSKIASSKIKIGAKLTIAGLVKAAISYTSERAKKEEGSTGDRGTSSATGNCGASSATGDRGASSATGIYGASSATGNRGASVVTGVESTASVGKGTGIAVAWGKGSSASGVIGSHLVLSEWSDADELINAVMIVVDGKKIKEDTFYRLVGGKVEEA